MVTIISVVISFILTAIVGNRLLQKWQKRAWLQQQAVLQAHKEIDEVKATIDNFMELADTRSYRARRLLRNLCRGTKERLNVVRSDYDQSVAAWNDQLNSFQVRLTIYAEYGYALRIEDEIQPRFAEISNTLEGLLNAGDPERREMHRRIYAQTEDQLNSLNGIFFNFSRDVMRFLVDRQRDIYLGKPIEFTRGTAELFPTWYLFKELFKSSHPPQTVFGTPFNPSSPSIFWDS